MLALRVVGGAYLLWLALQAFRRALRPSDVGPSDAAEAPTPAGPRRGLLDLAAAGLLFQVTNPKSLLVWVAVSAVSGVHAAPAPVLATFLAGAILISLAAHGGWGLALATAPARAAYARARRSVEAALGAAFATAGLSLLAQRG
jgi:threonine/homoserine/homoserine lactone efflux protein